MSDKCPSFLPHGMFSVLFSKKQSEASVRTQRPTRQHSGRHRLGLLQQIIDRPETVSYREIADTGQETGTQPGLSLD